MPETEVPEPSSPEDLDDYHYHDLQKLAADLGYGRIAGVKGDELKSFITGEFFDGTDPDQAGNQSEPASDEDECSSATPTASSTESQPTTSENSSTNGEATTDGGSITVSHEGKEKLSPEGFEDESVSSIDAPDGVDLPDDVTPDDLEPGDDEETIEGDAANDPQDGDDSGSDSGLLSRIRGESDEKTPEDVVEDAPNEAERDRRENLLSQLEGSTAESSDDVDETGEQPDEQSDSADTTATSSPSPTQMGNGLVVDESLMATLFGLPFSQASEVTGWDGWELSEQEKRANAELIVAYCDEQNIDLSAGSMLAMSLMSTVGGRAAGYMQHRRSGTDSAEPAESVEEQSENGATAEQVAEAIGSEQPDEQSPDDGNFDFSDSSTW